MGLQVVLAADGSTAAEQLQDISCDCGRCSDHGNRIDVLFID